MQYAKTRLFSLIWNSKFLYNSIRGCNGLLFDILLKFLCHTSPKLRVSVNAIVFDFGKLTEPRKKQLKVEILHNLKEFFNFHLVCKIT